MSIDRSKYILNSDLQGFGNDGNFRIQLTTPSVTISTAGALSSRYTQSIPNIASRYSIVNGLIKVTGSGDSTLSGSWLAINNWLSFNNNDGFIGYVRLARDSSSLYLYVQYYNNLASASVTVPSISYDLRGYVFSAPWSAST